MRTFFGILAAMAIAAPLCAASADTVRKLEDYPKVVGLAGVTDGDTIRMAKAVATQNGKSKEMTGVRIRFHGIDAPEKGQTCEDASGEQSFCGHDATKAMSEIIRGKEVTCYVLDVDRYGRLVSICSVAGVPDINGDLVKRGLAVAYRTYSTDYVDEEEAARAGRAGMWAGTFEMPWDWRKTH